MIPAYFLACIIFTPTEGLVGLETELDEVAITENYLQFKPDAKDYCEAVFGETILDTQLYWEIPE